MAQKKRERAKAAPHNDDEQPPSLTQASFPIVGVGASAGGLEAFREMLTALPPDANMAYVLVLHQPSTHVSMLPEILARSTALPLAEIYDGMALEPNRVYVLPPGSDVDLDDGMVRLTPRAAGVGQHRPIDHFFHSLAQHHAHKAIGVILSGTASDGTRGVQEIKAGGGVTFAQDDTAQQRSMPHTAIASGAIDFVMRPSDIARELGRIGAHPTVAEIPPESALPDFNPILDILREAVGVDFASYKRNTLYRRIVRRMVLHKLEALADYMELLRSSRAEIDALYQDILINVTSFFRNPEAFAALKAEVFPVLTHNRSRHDPVRIWALGCSTGEEAYSIAMAFAEYAESLGHAVPLQIFATDLNHAGIDKARAGLYSKSQVAEVSPERLRRFFVEADGSYRIAKEVRDTCIFARHNVLDDPPFSRMDLVSCRNLLIYLAAELQEKVIPVLYYALRPNGFLWLGTSETIGSYRDLFELRNNRYKIYAKKLVSAATLPIAAPRARAAPSGGLPARLPAQDTRSIDPQRDVERILVARYAPPGVLIRSDLEIVQYRGDTAPYLTPAPGRATLNLLKMLREGLVLAVRSAVQHAKTGEMPARTEGVTVATDGGERKVNIEVIPVKTGLERPELFLVLFEDAPQPPAPRDGAPADDAAAQDIAQLRQELTATREYLHAVIEEQEAANEQLLSANEEVQSANEELQSINEELETSKEEVQSANEELATVNDELHERNATLAQMNKMLERSQQLLRQQMEFLDQIHEPIAMWELEGNLTYWNKAAEEAYGFTREQAIGRKPHELLLASPPYAVYAGELRQTGRWSGEIAHMCSDGQKVIVESRMVVVTDTEGRTLVVQADRVITARKESERLLRDRADELTAADRHKDEFLAMLAHELRNPLAPLTNMLGVLRSEAAGKTRERALAIMERQVRNLSRLVEDLLDVSRIVASKLELRKSLVDLDAIVRRVTEEHEEVVRERGQNLHFVPAQEPVFVDGDEVRLEQILRNVLNNASKYTGRGGDITVQVTREDAHAVVRVKDTGIGIDAEKLPYIFEPFVRATTEERYGGLGIGLTLVRRLTELHGGEVEARSDGVDRGAEFIVRLPLKADKRTAERRSVRSRFAG